MKELFCYAMKKTKIYNTDNTTLIKNLPSKLEQKGYKMKEIGKNMIIMDTPSSFLSWGEKITISINDDHGCNVTITSNAKYQLTDWGKSKDNIDKVFSIIDNVVGA